MALSPEKATDTYVIKQVDAILCMNNYAVIKIFRQRNLDNNSKTYPVFFNNYRWLSILAESFTSVMHYTSIIIWREK